MDTNNSDHANANPRDDKKRNRAAAKLDRETEGSNLLQAGHPTMDDFRQVVAKSLASKSKTKREKNRIVIFLTQWNTTLEDGWLRKIVSAHPTSTIKLSARLTEDECRIVVYLGTLLSCASVPEWGAKLAPAFDSSKTKVKEEKKNYFEKFVFPVSMDNTTSGKPNPL